MVPVQRSSNIHVHGAAWDRLRRDPRNDSRARNQFLRGEQFRRKRRQLDFQSGSLCGVRGNTTSAERLRTAGTRWPISTDLQNCHHSSILSAHCSRQHWPTQVSLVFSKDFVQRSSPVEIDVRTQDQVKIIKLRGKLSLGPSLD